MARILVVPRRLLLILLVPTLLAAAAKPAHADGLDPLYDRIAVDLRAGKPLVVTLHVALCDSSIIPCGNRTLGNGDAPGKNLYWGGAAGLRAFFDYRRAYQRIFKDGGDGKVILERVVYRLRVRRPSARWRRRGVKGGFELLVVGLAYRGKQISRAMAALVAQVSRDEELSTTSKLAGGSLKLPDGRVIPIGARGHVVGYAGHNHLMDVTDFRWPSRTRKRALGYFALACLTAEYLAPQLSKLASARALLLTRSLMYPGAFTIDGLVRGLAEGALEADVFRRGADAYAHFQKRPKGRIRFVFTHQGRKGFWQR